MSSEHFNENQPYLIQNSHSRIIIDLVFLIEQQTKAKMIRIYRVQNVQHMYYTQCTTHDCAQNLSLKSYSDIAAMKSFKNPTASSILETVPVSNASGTD